MIIDCPERWKRTREICLQWGRDLKLGREGEPDPIFTLLAILLNERYNEDNQEPRKERAYCPGGLYFHKIEPLWSAFGESAAKSYSNFQILFVTANELGFAGFPEELDDDAIAVRWVVALLNQRIIWRARREFGLASLTNIFDGYNSGNPCDKRIPEEYIKKGLKHYAEVVQNFPQWLEEDAALNLKKPAVEFRPRMTRSRRGGI